MKSLVGERRAMDADFKKRGINCSLQSEKEINGVHFIITKWYDEAHFFKKIDIVDEAMLEPFTYTEKVAKFSLGDFTEMFSYQGLQIQEVFGDYQFGHYDIRKSPRLIMIAKKIK